MPAPHFDPSTAIPLLSGKVVFVTGGTAGLGRETIMNLAAHSPAHIYFSGRSQSSANELLKVVREKHPSTPITFIQADLASIASIKAAANQFLSQSTRLDLFFANAGVMSLPPGLTKDGYEIQFGTNHLGHAALVKILLPTLEATARQGHDVRVIWTSSLGYRAASGIDFASLKTTQAHLSPVHFMSEWFRYGQSKLANLLYAREFTARHPLVTSVSVHPGVAATELARGLGFFNRWFVKVTTLGTMVSVEECAWNQQWAASAPKGNGKGEVLSGTYYEPVGVKGKLTKAGANDGLAKELWEWTEKELEGHGI